MNLSRPPQESLEPGDVPMAEAAGQLQLPVEGTLLVLVVLSPPPAMVHYPDEAIGLAVTVPWRRHLLVKHVMWHHGQRRARVRSLANSELMRRSAL